MTQTSDPSTTRGKQGFAGLSPEQRREAQIAGRKGGRPPKHRKEEG